MTETLIAEAGHTSVACNLADLRRAVASRPRPVGLVPLTFDIHEGHLSLVRRAHAECATVVVGLFSHIRYGPQQELIHRPRSPEHDLALLGASGSVDVLLRYGEFPPPDRSSWVEVGPLGRRWEGLRFPSLFPAGATAVRNMLQAAIFDRLYLGEKDYQQFLILRAIAQAVDPALTVVACPTAREPDGLAVSTSNLRLSPGQRRRAPALWWALAQASGRFAAGERGAGALQAAMLAQLREDGVTPDYAAIVDAETLAPIRQVDRPARALVAAYIGEGADNLWRARPSAGDSAGVVRLADNVALDPGRAAEVA